MPDPMSSTAAIDPTAGKATLRAVLRLDDPRLPELLDVPLVAELPGKKKSRVYEIIAAGSLPVIKLGHRVYVPRRSLVALIDAAAAKAAGVQDGALA